MRTPRDTTSLLAELGKDAGKIVLIGLIALMIVAALALSAKGQQGFPEQGYPPQGQYDQGQQGPDDPDADAPDRGVARISVMNGNVSIRRGDSGDLVAGALNAPVVATDRIETGDGGRAEVQFDSANMIRLAPATEVRFSELEYHKYQVQLAIGTATFRVLRDSDAQVEISTPNISVRPTRKGIYRVTVQPDGSSEITVREGDADIFTPRGSERIRAGETMVVRGTVSDPEYQIVRAYPQDDWDRWNAGRDQDLLRATSSQYVSPDVYGSEDLDRYGRWTNDPQYGNVWAPTVGADWAPYQAGRWVWIDYYGWTWVSDDPWGWAPYHYGRWYHAPFGWAWYPGPRVGRYYWRPALVGFFGWGGSGYGGGFGFGFSNVGWVPLAPFEPYHPWYGRGFYGGGYRNINIINNTNIVNVYRNARVNNGIVGMRSEDFGRNGVNRGNFVRASQGDLARAGMVRGQLPLTPSRESTQFTNRQVITQGLPSRSFDNRQFVSSRPAPQINRVPFEQQRQNMQQGFTQQGGRGFNSAPSGNQQPQILNNGGNNAGGNIGNGSGNNGGFANRPGGNRFEGIQPGFGNQAPANQAVPQNTSPQDNGAGRFSTFPSRGNRFGSVQPGSGNQAPANQAVPQNTSPQDNGAGRFSTFPSRGNRFEGVQPGPGNQAPANQAVPQNTSPQDNGAGRFSTFPARGNRFEGNQRSPAVVEQPQSRPAPQNYAPAAPSGGFDRGGGRFGGPAGGSTEPRGFNQQQPVRISPPIVTNRSQQGGGGSFNQPGGGGGGGGFSGTRGGGNPAPRNEGGGGGGGNRGGGGGGGGGNRGGGGGGHTGGHGR